VEEINAEILEKRSGHVREKCFQIPANTPECEILEVRKSDVSGGGRVQQFHFNIMIGNRGEKPYIEYL
jgi:hypothetical protein